MQSLKQQFTVLVVVSILILSVSLMLSIGLQIRETAVLACMTKAKSDLAAGEAIINLKYPGSWRLDNGYLYKGDVRINNNNEIVDYISELTGSSSTIFLGNKRVATTIKKHDGQRAVGTHASEEVSKRVLNQGKEYIGEAEVVGQTYQTAYKPIYDDNGNIVGMFYVGISKAFYDQLLYNSLRRMAVVGTSLTVLVFVGTMFFTKRYISDPLKQLTEETQKFAKGDFCSLHYPAEINDSKNEIGELARSIHQIGEWVQSLNEQINRKANSQANYIAITTEVKEEGTGCCGLNGKNNPNGKEKWGELSKGLNEVTLNQIFIFMQDKDCSLSASEIAREVKLTKVTVRRYLECMEKCGRVSVDMQYGPVGRPLKLYKLNK